MILPFIEKFTRIKYNEEMLRNARTDTNAMLIKSGGVYMQVHHYFLAIPIHQTQGSSIQKWLDVNKDQLPFQKWVYPEDYHVTLAFLGDIETERKKVQLQHAVKTVTSQMPSFSLSLKGIGIFGPESSPRIFWASMNESGALHHLQKNIYQACVDTNFKLDKKPFHPHITLARKWAGHHPYPKGKDYDLAFQEVDPVVVDRIHLYETHLDQRPKYKIVETFSLQAHTLEG